MRLFLAFVGMLLIGAAANTACAQILTGFALDTCREYTSLETALANKDQVVKLNLRKHKLKEIPEDITQFPNLQVLNLSKNKLTTLPSFVGQLSKLTHLDVSRNRIDTMVPEFCNLTNLREFHAGMNEIRYLPDSLHNCERLQVLDLWSNNIGSLPESTTAMRYLTEVDLRAISMSESEQKAIRAIVPQATIHFSQHCNCD